jgi:hypothetical protein
MKKNHIITKMENFNEPDYYFFQHPDNKKTKTKYYKHLEQTISDLLRFKINEKI